MGVISIVNGDYKPTYNWGGTTLYPSNEQKKEVVSNYKRSDQQDPGGANSHLQNGKSRIQLMEVRKRTICLAI